MGFSSLIDSCTVEQNLDFSYINSELVIDINRGIVMQHSLMLYQCSELKQVFKYWDHIFKDYLVSRVMLHYKMIILNLKYVIFQVVFSALCDREWPTSTHKIKTGFYFIFY